MKKQFQTSSAFPEPNYTQVPNDFFDMLPDMESSEARVTIVMIRNTFGFHRNEFKLSIDKLAAAAGISHNSAKSGAELAEKRGTFKRSNPYGQGEAEWELVVGDQQLTPSTIDPLPPQPLVGGDQPLTHSIEVKESIKESKEILNQLPKPKSAQQLMIESLCSVMGLEVNLNASRVSRLASELVKMTVTPAQIQSAYGAGDTWWYKDDWRGKRGQKPTESAIRETLNSAAAAPAVKVIRQPQPRTIKQP